MIAFIENRAICTIYIVLGLVTAITLAILIPPMQNPDEMAHFYRADQISRGRIIGQRYDVRIVGGKIAVGIGTVNSAMGDIPMHPSVKVTRKMITEANTAHWTDGTTRAGFANTVVYPPIFYLPSAVGIKIGKALNLRIVQTLYISRILSAVVSVSIGALAILVAGTAAPWIFAVVTLPTAFSLSATSGQEGMLNATAAFACACFLGHNTDRNRKLATFYSGAIALLLIISARPPLIPLALILPAVPRVSWRHRAIGLAIVIAGTAGWMIAAGSTFINPRIGLDFTINPDDFGTVKQLHYIATHPVEFYWVFVKTLHTWAPNFYQAFVGVLGWYDVFVPRWFEIVTSVTLFFAFLASISERYWLSPLQAIATVIGIIGCFVGTIVAQYLAWTPIGLDIILGIQGRYFIAPAFFIVMLSPSLALPRVVRSTLIALTIGFATAVTAPLTGLLTVHRYYLT